MLLSTILEFNADVSAFTCGKQLQKKQVQAVKIQIDAIRDDCCRSLVEKKRELSKLERLRAAQRVVKTLEREVRDLEEQIVFLEQLKAQLDPWAPFKKPFLWPVEFPEVFDRGGFDIVVANPP